MSHYGFLRRPRWIGAGLVVAGLAVLFVNLGFWQLRRLQERRVENVVFSARLVSTPTEVTAMVNAAGGEVESLRYRRAFAVGIFRPDSEVLVRSQTDPGPGFHVVTPLVLGDGRAILVDRGWVPLTMDHPPVEPGPPTGEVMVEGLAMPSESPTPLSPQDPPEGRLTQVARVDLNRLGSQLGWKLLPVYLAISGPPPPAGLPVPPPTPTFTDAGPHLGYAIQWFGFAVVGLVGFVALARRAAGQA